MLGGAVGEGHCRYSGRRASRSALASVGSDWANRLGACLEIREKENHHVSLFDDSLNSDVFQ